MWGGRSCRLPVRRCPVPAGQKSADDKIVRATAGSLLREPLEFEKTIRTDDLYALRICGRRKSGLLRKVRKLTARASPAARFQGAGRRRKAAGRYSVAEILRAFPHRKLDRRAPLDHPLRAGSGVSGFLSPAARSDL